NETREGGAGGSDPLGSGGTALSASAPRRPAACASPPALLFAVNCGTPAPAPGPPGRQPKPVTRRLVAIGSLERGDIARALVARRVGPGRDREQAARLADGAEALACHPARQFLEQNACVTGLVPEQRRGGHHHVGTGQQVPCHVGGVLDAGG